MNTQQKRNSKPEKISESSNDSLDTKLKIVPLIESNGVKNVKGQFIDCPSGKASSQIGSDMNEIPRTPSTVKTTNQTRRILQYKNDLNSPSAAARLKAIRALRNPEEFSYNYFDIPHDEIDIITDEERRKPNIPKTIQEVMKDVVIYVEVRTKGDNRSAGVKSVISLLGAQINDKFLRNTTHVVFKDGLQSTYNKAKKWNIPVVSILWVEECKKQIRLINPKLFPISNIHRYENPEFYSNSLKYKIRSPNVDNTRINKTKSDKTATPKKPKNKLNEIQSEFQPTIINSSIQSGDNLKYSRNFTGTISGTTESQKDECVNKSSSNILESTQTSSSQYKSFYDEMSSAFNDPLAKYEIDIPLNNNRCNNENIENPKNYLNVNKSVLLEEDNTKENGNSDKSNVNSVTRLETANNEQGSNTNCSVSSRNRRRTSYTIKSLDISYKPTKNVQLDNITPLRRSRRRTILHISQHNDLDMDDSNSTSKRKLSSLSEQPAIKADGDTITDSNIDMETTLTPNEPKPIIIFNSTKTARNTRRRTQFDISMDIIDQRLESINKSVKQLKTPMSNDINLKRKTNNDDVNDLNVKTDDVTSHTNQRTPTTNSFDHIPKKRKLFNSTDLLNLSNSSALKEKLPSNTKTLDSYKVDTSKGKRKSLLKPAKLFGNDQQKYSQRFSINSKVIQKPDTQQNDQKSSFLVCTNMNSKQKEFITKAVEKLGGFQIEDTVSENTTHLVTAESRRTVNILRAIIRGLWILELKWVTDSLTSERWLFEEQYENINFSRAVQICRAERQAFGFGYKAPVFKDCEPIFISKHSIIPAKYLKELISMCSGCLVDSKKKARYIIGELCKEYPDKICVESQWILDSIMDIRLKSIKKYIIKP